MIEVNSSSSSSLLYDTSIVNTLIISFERAVPRSSLMAGASSHGSIGQVGRQQPLVSLLWWVCRRIELLDYQHRRCRAELGRSQIAPDRPQLRAVILVSQSYGGRRLTYQEQVAPPHVLDRSNDLGLSSRHLIVVRDGLVGGQHLVAEHGDVVLVGGDLVRIHPYGHAPSSVAAPQLIRLGNEPRDGELDPWVLRHAHPEGEGLPVIPAPEEEDRHRVEHFAGNNLSCATEPAVHKDADGARGTAEDTLVDEVVGVADRLH